MSQVTTKLRAEILGAALPYMQQYYNKVVVIKYGGNAMIDEDLKTSVINDIVLLSLVGIKVVLVHGGGPEINEQLEKIGKEAKFINGLRYTDQETMDVVQMVLCGKINKSLVQLVEKQGGKAIGLCGLDGSMIEAKELNKELGFVGDITNINTKPIYDALDAGYIPVISTIATGEGSTVYNINADTAAAKIAAALKAENLILMTNIKGLLRDVNDESTLISEVGISEVPKLIKENIISGGMIPKIESCVEAIRRGVGRTFIIDGRIEHSILIEMFTNEGIGTMFK